MDRKDFANPLTSYDDQLRFHFHNLPTANPLTLNTLGTNYLHLKPSKISWNPSFWMRPLVIMPINHGARAFVPNVNPNGPKNKTQNKEILWVFLFVSAWRVFSTWNLIIIHMVFFGGGGKGGPPKVPSSFIFQWNFKTIIESALNNWLSILGCHGRPPLLPLWCRPGMVP